MENQPSSSSPTGQPPEEVVRELTQNIAEKRDVELLAMFESPDNWRPESLDAARAELQKRKLAIPSQEDSASPGTGEGPTIRTGIMCVQHPNVQATQQCRRCGSYMCATCDFAFPQDMHFCPKCISTTETGLSARQKKFMIWSYVLAAWSTFGMTCLISGAMSGLARTKQEQAGLGWVLLLFVLGPALTGLSLGMTAKRKQGANPSTLWIAIIWNAILITSFVVLMFIGLTNQ